MPKKWLPMDKRFAIFDMDGTLVDSMIYWKNLVLEYLHSKGIGSVPPDLMERIKPMTMSESAELFLQKFGLSGDPESEMNAMMSRHYEKDIPLKSGVGEYLRKLERCGVRMCVASATAEPLMEACLTRLGVRDKFEFLLSCETVGAGKESPLVYHVSAGRFGTAPGNIAIYEDALYAVQTAKNAGFYVIGVYDAGAAENWKSIVSMADETILNWEDEV